MPAGVGYKLPTTTLVLSDRLILPSLTSFTAHRGHMSGDVGMGGDAASDLDKFLPHARSSYGVGRVGVHGGFCCRAGYRDYR